MIVIVYHCYLVGDWRTIISKQLNRLKDSHLYDKCDEFHMTINLANEKESVIDEIISEYPKIKPYFFKENNAEYPAIKKIRELSFEKDAYFLYFHSKGVSNNYQKFNSKKINNEKIKNIESWKNCLEYFLIDKWESCIQKLEEYDIAGVSCVNGWYWGNFWWSKSSYLNKTIPVNIWSRWDYEAWLTKGINNPKIFEFFHFNFNPYLTYFDEDLYIDNKFKDSDIVIRSAKYGTPDFEIDEGYSGSKLGVQVDVKKYVLEFLREKNNKKLEFDVNNHTMGGDPTYGSKKFLMLELSPQEDISKKFKLSISEGNKLVFKF